MKTYENPTIDINLFSKENIITASGLTATDAAKESLGIDTEGGVPTANLFEFIF